MPMQPCGGGCAQEYHLSARRLLGGHAAPASPPVSLSVSVDMSALDQSVDAQRAHLERVLAATTTVLFLASVSCIALNTLYCCIHTRRRRREPAPVPSAALPAGEETKRALEGISVQVVLQARDGGGGGRKGGGRAAEVDETDCAVCLAEYAVGDEVRVLPACRHGFHRACVDRWLLTLAPTCPVCRAPVGPVDQPHVKEDCATGHGDTRRGGSRVLPAMWPAVSARRVLQ